MLLWTYLCLSFDEYTYASSVSSKKCVRFVSVETAKMFSQVFVPILTPTSSVWVLIVPHPHEILDIVSFLFLNIPLKMGWYSTVILIYIPLIIKRGEHLFICLLITWRSFEKGQFKYFVHFFYWIIYLSSYWIVVFFTYSEYESFERDIFCKYLLQLCGLPFLPS